MFGCEALFWDVPVILQTKEKTFENNQTTIIRKASVITNITLIKIRNGGAGEEAGCEQPKKKPLKKSPVWQRASGNKIILVSLTSCVVY